MDALLRRPTVRYFVTHFYKRLPPCRRPLEVSSGAGSPLVSDRSIRRIPADGPNSFPVVVMPSLPRGFQLTGPIAFLLSWPERLQGLVPNTARKVIGPLLTLFSHRKKRGGGILQKSRLPVYGWNAVDVAAWCCLLIDRFGAHRVVSEPTEYPGCHGSKRRGRML